MLAVGCRNDSKLLELTEPPWIAADYRSEIRTTGGSDRQVPCVSHERFLANRSVV